LVGIPLTIITLYYSPSLKAMGWVLAWCFLVAGYYVWRADHVRLIPKFEISEFCVQETPTEGLQRRVNIQLIARCLTDAHVKECQGYLLRVYKKNDKSDWDPTAMNESHILDWSRHGTTPLTLKPGIDQRLDVCFIQSDFLRMIPAITRLPSIWRTVFDSNGTFRFDIKVIAEDCVPFDVSIAVSLDDCEWGKPKVTLLS
jgi:hypothetical protein